MHLGSWTELSRRAQVWAAPGEDPFEKVKGLITDLVSDITRDFFLGPKAQGREGSGGND